MSSRMNKADKEALKVLLEKHQRKHPGCKLSEKKCNSKLSGDCIVKGDMSLFQKTGAICKECVSAINQQYYETVTVKKRAKARKERLSVGK